MRIAVALGMHRAGSACLFMVIHHAVPTIPHQLVALGDCEVFADHLGDQFLEGDLGGPAEFFLGLAGVAQQGFDFGGAEIPIVNGDDRGVRG